LPGLLIFEFNLKKKEENMATDDQMKRVKAMQAARKKKIDAKAAKKLALQKRCAQMRKIRLANLAK